jgi:hypothetical protein
MTTRYRFSCDDTPGPTGPGWFDRARLFVQIDDGGQSRYETVCFLPDRKTAEDIADALNKSVYRATYADVLRRTLKYGRHVGHGYARDGLDEDGCDDRDD